MTVTQIARVPLIVGVVLTSTAAVTGATPVANVNCADLSSFAWSGFRVDTAEAITATDGSVAHCRVRGTIDEEIHFELLLPEP